MSSDEILPSAEGPAPTARSVHRKRFGPFEVRAELGRGGMGVVYRAWDEAAQREVALKVLSSASPTDVALERFTREGQALARLDHPAILRVFSAGVIENLPYLACELIEGAQPLDEAWAQHSPRERAELLLSVAEGLTHALERGVIHRDLKPDNVLVDRQGNPRLADFGLAQVTDLERLTLSGALLGTPLYMSPEQLSGVRADARVDVWGLGVLLYEALTDQRPFDADSLLGLTVAVNSPPPPPRELRPDVDPALAALCLRALRSDRDERPADAQVFARELRACLAGEAPLLPRARPGPWIVAALVVVAVLVALVASPPSQDAPKATPSRGVASASLELETPPAQVWTDHIVIRGRLGEGGPGTEWPSPPPLQPGVTEQSLRLGLAPDESFERRVPLAPGVNRIRVRTAGSTREAYLTIERLTPPSWYLKLPRQEQPRLPLPPGVEFRPEPGEYLLRRDGGVLVWVPPGRFTQGEGEAFGPAGPAHPVTLSRGYFIGKYEVTWRQYRLYASALSIAPPDPLHPVSPDHPVHAVNWSRAQKYCAWAGGRLPTEAEWERAARGTQPRSYPWGEEPPDPKRANFDPTPGLPINGKELSRRPTRSALVGVEGASPVGCFNMGGNVWEWVEDWWGRYSDEPARDPRGASGAAILPMGPSKRPARVIRGGSCREGSLMVRAAHRYYYKPKSSRADIGFRFCLVPGERRPLTWKVRWFEAGPTLEAAGSEEVAQRWEEAKASATAPVRVEGLRLYYGKEGPAGLGLLPAGESLGPTDFGTLAETEVELEAGEYLVGGISDDALRVWVDDQLLIDAWEPHLVFRSDASLTLTEARRVRIRVEHLQGEGFACLDVWLARR